MGCHPFSHANTTHRPSSHPVLRACGTSSAQLSPSPSDAHPPHDSVSKRVSTHSKPLRIAFRSASGRDGPAAGGVDAAKTSARSVSKLEPSRAEAKDELSMGHAVRLSGQSRFEVGGTMARLARARAEAEAAGICCAVIVSAASLVLEVAAEEGEEVVVVEADEEEAEGSAVDEAELAAVALGVLEAPSVVLEVVLELTPDVVLDEVEDADVGLLVVLLVVLVELAEMHCPAEHVCSDVQTLPTVPLEREK